MSGSSRFIRRIALLSIIASAACVTSPVRPSSAGYSLTVVPAASAVPSADAPSVTQPVRLAACRVNGLTLAQRAVADSAAAIKNAASRHFVPARDVANAGEKGLVAGEFIAPLSLAPHQAPRDWTPRALANEVRPARPTPGTC